MIIFTKEWDNFVKKWEKKSKVGWSTGKRVIEYIYAMQDLIRCEYAITGIKENVYISIGDAFRTYKMYNGKGYKIELSVKKEMEELYEMVEGFKTPSRLLKFSSVLGHEFAHIKYGDLIGISARERIINWNKLNRALSVFSECRADIMGKEFSQACYGGWTHRWIRYSESDPLKSGYLKSTDRKKIMEKYNCYNKETMIEIYQILQQYGLPDYTTFCNYIFKNVDINSEKGQWVRELLFIA